MTDRDQQDGEGVLIRLHHSVAVTLVKCLPRSLSRAVQVSVVVQPFLSVPRDGEKKNWKLNNKA